MSPAPTVSVAVAVAGIEALSGAVMRTGTLTEALRPTVTVVVAGDTLSPPSTAAVTVTGPEPPPNRRTVAAAGTVCPGATPTVRGAVSAITPWGPAACRAMADRTLGRSATGP